MGLTSSAIEPGANHALLMLPYRAWALHLDVPSYPTASSHSATADNPSAEGQEIPTHLSHAVPLESAAA